MDLPLKKKPIVSLRFSILSIFLTLFTIAILLLTTLTYIRSKSAMLYTASQMMKSISDSILLRINMETEAAANELVQTIQYMQEQLLEVNDISKLRAYFASLGSRYDIIKSAYWADEQGRIILAETNVDNKIAIRTTNLLENLHSEDVIYYNPDRKQIAKKIEPITKYDPRQREWYRRAKTEKKIIWTDFYMFFSGEMGITWAAPVFDNKGKLKGVFGLDISIESLTNFIQDKKIGENGFAFIINTAGKVIAFPDFLKKKQKKLIDIKDLHLPWLQKSFEEYQRIKQTNFSFQYDDKAYLARYEKIPYFSQQGLLLGMIVPENDFIAELKKDMALDIFLSLIILIIGSLFISHLVTHIIEPIKKLVKHTQFIKNFELSHDLKINSRIKEVIALTDSLEAMRLGLKAFQQYVPASLVRQLIETRQNARIGGIKKKLTILFTDIRDFTQIAETMEPNILMEYMCEYFNALSQIISAEKGTIDKYIGDSIMAFWGAPLFVADSCEHAAKAALACEKKLNKLNLKWIKEHKKPLFTRIGIHTGDAIVGNVGSEERLNYTALGDAINEASRLEEVNKLYGTKIIVSAAVYEKIKEKFILRKIDRITVKGKTAIETIYELLAQHKNELTFDVDALLEHFGKGFSYYQIQHWQDAILEFKICLTIYPEDSVSISLIQRCNQLILHNPKEWDGIWRVNE